MNAGSVACGWQAAPDLLWTQFADSTDWVIYHPASSNAYLVSDAARRLWVLAGGDASDSRDLAATLAANADQLVNPEFQAAVMDMMAFLDRSGLLRPRRV